MRRLSLGFSGLLFLAACGSEVPIGEGEAALTYADELNRQTGGGLDIGTDTLAATDGSYDLGWAAAYFYKNAPSNCAITAAGNYCAVIDCMEPTSGLHQHNADAGKITITGGATPMELTPTAHAYPDIGVDGFADMGSFWSSNIAVTAAGGDIPAFSVAGLHIPSMVHVDNVPLGTYGGVTAPRLNLPRNADLPLQWTGGGSDWLDFSLDDYSGTYHTVDDGTGQTYLDLDITHRHALLCLVPAQDAQFVIPAAGLAAFEAGSETAEADKMDGGPGRFISLNIASVQRTTVLADAVTPISIVVHSALTSADSQVQQEITFQ
jgi:hypothetical protein